MEPASPCSSTPTTIWWVSYSGNTQRATLCVNAVCAREGDRRGGRGGGGVSTWPSKLWVNEWLNSAYLNDSEADDTEAEHSNRGAGLHLGSLRHCAPAYNHPNQSGQQSGNLSNCIQCP